MESLTSPVTIVSIVVIIALILYWLHAFFILYHLIRFGVGTRPKKASLIFFLGSLLLFFLLITAALAIAIEAPPVLKMITT